jgi:pimeloyl-ACP methyl ester carboxylesterase
MGATACETQYKKQERSLIPLVGPRGTHALPKIRTYGVTLGHARLWLAGAATILLGACGGGSSDLPPLAQSKPASAPPLTYGTLGSGPLVVVLAGDQSDTLNDPAYTGGLVPALVSAGYTVLSADLPCHGADATPADGSPLDCWALRIAGGDKSLFLRFCVQLSDILDARGVTVAVVAGISRGGYMAVTCAAYEPRFTAIALNAPVTDLNYLLEFKNYPVDESLFNIQQYEPYVFGRPVFVRGATDDTRVGSAGFEALATTLHARTEFLPGTEHAPPEDGSTITWITVAFPVAP